MNCILCNKPLVKGQKAVKHPDGMMHLSCAEAEQKRIDAMDLEIARRLEEIEMVESRDDFYKFCRYMDSEFFSDAKWHLKLAAEYMQQLALKEIPMLLVSMAPRAGKSYIVSLFHAWLIGKFPEDSSMRNSYAGELAEKFSYDIREMIQKPKYLNVFPNIKLKDNRKSINDWAVETARDSTYFCAGVGGAILGKGCRRIATLDDPIKNIEAAMSETIIDAVWNWYTSTHVSRMESGCSELHVATRWSRRDPIGRIIRDKKLEQIEPFVYRCGNAIAIVIPALIDGKSFCEEIHTTEEYLYIKSITEDFIWEAEYMQNPIESKGLLFPMEELKRFSLKEIDGKDYDAIIGFTDTADEGTDYLSSPVGKKIGEYTYITDVVFTQDPIEITEPLVAQQIIDSECELMKVESNSGGKSFALNVEKLIKGKSTCDVVFEPQTANKETRILMNAGYIKKHFWFREDYAPGSDYDHFMRALTSYVRLGKNKHDDACFPAGTMIATLFGDKPIEKVKKGEFVITPFGIRKVLWSGTTGTKPLINNMGIVATASHKIFDGTRFSRLDTLTGLAENSIISLKELIRWKYKKLSSLMVLNTDLWGREGIILANQRAMKEGDIPKDFMLRFGNFIAGKRFLRAIKFTTKMVTLLITTSIIWNVYSATNIFRNTVRNGIKTIKNSLMKTWQKFKAWQRNGIKVPREESGTKNMQKIPLHTERSMLKHVSFVAKSMKPLWKNLFVALRSVLKNTDGKTRREAYSKEYVLCAEQNLKDTERMIRTSRRKHAQSCAKTGSIIETGNQKVYNLTVEKDHVYYADGLLVSNCDSLTGLVEYVKLLNGKTEKKKPPVGYYTDSELADKGYKPYEIKRIKKTMCKPWERVK